MTSLQESEPQIAHLSDRHLLVFDLNPNGHHPIYIQHLLKAWTQRSISERISVIVAPEFLRLYADLFEPFETTKQIQIIPISTLEQITLTAQTSALKQVFFEWKLFCHYAKSLKATQALFPYIDHLQLPLAIGDSAPCPVSGIYFRPTFHYDQFRHYRSTLTDKIRQLRQKLVLFLAMRQPQLETLFCLDPFAIAAIRSLNPRVNVLPLADPVEPHQADPFDVAALRQRLGIEPDRKVLLMLGAIDGRKGIYPTLGALRSLSTEKLCLLLAGRVEAAEKTRLNDEIAQLSATHPIQIILRDQFVPNADVPCYFQLADIVLAPYQRHVGMSGILLQAAAARKPILASNYGLMGELVDRYQLGLSIDSEHAEQIAQGLVTLLQSLETPGNSVYSLENMKELVAQNRVEQFIETIFLALGVHTI